MPTLSMGKLDLDFLSESSVKMRQSQLLTLQSWKEFNDDIFCWLARKKWYEFSISRHNIGIYVDNFFLVPVADPGLLRRGMSTPEFGPKTYYYHPQTKLRKGNVFTPVCQSFCSHGGVCLSACWDTSPQGDTTPGQNPPPSACWDIHPPLHRACWDTQCPVHAGIDMATAADGKHPTGMHSCLARFLPKTAWK